MPDLPPPYADLEIRILERQEAGYPVEITFDRRQEFPRGFLAGDILPWGNGSDYLLIAAKNGLKADQAGDCSRLRVARPRTIAS